MTDTYKIVRYYSSDTPKHRVIARGLSLEDAQKHCSSEKTHKKDNRGNILWFDGYTKE